MKGTSSFESKILDGQLCYSLDVAKMIGKTKTGRANGLFLLLDPNPYQLNITEENKEGWTEAASTLNVIDRAAPSRTEAVVLERQRRRSDTSSWKTDWPLCITAADQVRNFSVANVAESK